MEWISWKITLALGSIFKRSRDKIIIVQDFQGMHKNIRTTHCHTILTPPPSQVVNFNFIGHFNDNRIIEYLTLYVF